MKSSNTFLIPISEKIQYCTTSKQLAITHLLPDNRLYSKQMRGKLKSTSLHIAIIKEDWDTAFRIICNYHTQINATNIEGKTALHYAATLGNFELTKLLVEHNANINISDNAGRTPLHYAMTSPNPELLSEFLIDTGANISKLDVEHRSYLHYAVLNASPQIVRNLIIHSIDIDSKDWNEQTPLHLAIINGSASLKVLIENRAGIEIPDNKGKSPLMLATEFQNIDAIELLCKAGVNVNHQDQAGNSPLHLAATGALDYVMSKLSRSINIPNYKTFAPSVQLVQSLIDNKADIHLKNFFGMTALDTAIALMDWHHSSTGSCKINFKNREAVGRLILAENNLQTLHFNPIEFSYNFKTPNGKKLSLYNTPFPICGTAIPAAWDKSTLESLLHYIRFDSISDISKYLARNYSHESFDSNYFVNTVADYATSFKAEPSELVPTSISNYLLKRIDRKLLEPIIKRILANNPDNSFANNSIGVARLEKLLSEKDHELASGDEANQNPEAFVSTIGNKTSEYFRLLRAELLRSHFPDR